MLAQRVLIVWANPLFRDSVLRLLQHPDVQCVGALNVLDTLHEQIVQLEPDTVLVEENDGQIPPTIMHEFEQGYFRGRLVSFSLHNNRLSVYHREEWLVAQAGDLLHLILE